METKVMPLALKQLVLLVDTLSKAKHCSSDEKKLEAYVNAECARHGMGLEVIDALCSLHIHSEEGNTVEVIKEDV